MELDVVAPYGRPVRERLWRITFLDAGITLAVAGITAVSTVLPAVDSPGGLASLQVLLPWGLALLVVAVVPLLWLSAFPIPVAVVTVLATTAYYPLGYPDNFVILAGAVALFTLVARGFRLTGWLLGFSQYLVVHVAETLYFGAPRTVYALGMLAWVLVVFISGEVVRKHRAYLDMARKHSAEAERTREEETRRRISEERLKFAREVHDVIAHNISLINVQAGSALYLIDTQPERAAEALAAIKQASRETLQELRAILGVLRAVDETAPRSPAPGLDRLDELVAGVRSSANTEVSSRVCQIHPRRGVPPGVGRRPGRRCGLGSRARNCRHAGPRCRAGRRTTGRARSGGRVHGGGVAARLTGRPVQVRLLGRICDPRTPRRRPGARAGRVPGPARQCPGHQRGS